MVLALMLVVGRWGGGGGESEKWAFALHLMSCICNVGTSVSVQPRELAPVYSICYPACHSTPGHGHMPLAWPVDQHCSSLAWQLTKHRLTHNSSDRWMKRWATSCVKWTEGRGALAIMVKQTAKRDRHVRLWVCTTKKGAHRHVEKQKQSIKQNNSAL